jgi:hypothetical protein
LFHNVILCEHNFSTQFTIKTIAAESGVTLIRPESRPQFKLRYPITPMVATSLHWPVCASFSR